jgi:hypothetical protein
MGLVYDSHGRSRISVEERSESFYIHPGYGYDEEGNEHTDDIRTARGVEHNPSFAERWRKDGHPEFLLEDVPDLIVALADLPTCPAGVKEWARGWAVARAHIEGRG